MVGTLLMEQTKYGPKLWAVKSITKTGICTLISSDGQITSEGKTNKGFAEQVESGKWPAWTVLDSDRLAKLAHANSLEVRVAYEVERG